jgi:hypothetical protein
MGGLAPDTIGKYIAYTTGAFIGANSNIGIAYDFAPGSPYVTGTLIDSSYGWFDTARIKRSYHAGNVTIGPSSTSNWSSSYQLDLRGTSRFSDVADYASNIAANYTTRSFTDKNYVDSSISAIPAGGTPFLPVTGTGTATGAVTGELDGNVLTVTQAGNEMLHIDPTPGAEHTHLRAVNTTGAGNDATSYLETLDTQAEFGFGAQFNDNTKKAEIIGFADAAIGTLEYFADTHTFTGPLILNGTTSGSITVNSDALGNALNGTTLSGTGYVPVTMFARLTSDNTISNVDTDQDVFSSTLNSWTLQGSTTYWIEGEYYTTHSATAHSIAIGFAGTATFTSVSYSSLAWITAAGTQTLTQAATLIQSASMTVVNTSGSNAQEVVKFSGFISVNAGGTVIPQLKFSVAPGGTVLVKAGTYIKFTPVGTSSVESIGNVN